MYHPKTVIKVSKFSISNIPQIIEKFYYNCSPSRIVKCMTYFKDSNYSNFCCHSDKMKKINKSFKIFVLVPVIFFIYFRVHHGKPDEQIESVARTVTQHIEAKLTCSAKVARTKLASTKMPRVLRGRRALLLRCFLLCSLKMSMLR